MSVRPMSKCQTVKYVAAAGFLFLLILFFNYNLLLSEQYNSKVEEKKSDSEERLRRLERLMEREHPEIGNGQLEKRVNEIEKQIQERLPSSTDLLISDGRMNNLLGRLQKIEVTLKLLDNQRKSYVGIDSRVDLIEYRLDKMEKSSRIASSKNAKNNSCEVVHDWQYPFCDEKVQWMKSRWQDQYLCIVEEHKVDPFDMCSIIIYLSEVEAWCPILPARRKLPQNAPARRKKAFLERANHNLMDRMKQDHWRWMRQRIKRMWPLWINGLESLLGKNHPVEEHPVKKIFLYMGSFANNPAWFRQAFSGAPLGELVQWSDVIACLTILGHQVIISTRKEELRDHLSVPKSKSCPSKRREDEYDLVFTDYVGLAFMQKELGPNFSQYRCRLRILDSFGTEAQFNYFNPDRPITKKTSSWGHQNLHLQQFMTMFPHTQDNTFLGFVVEAPTNITKPVLDPPPGKKPIGLVYGKDSRFWLGKDNYLKVLAKHLELHGTVVGSVYVGLGFPYDGPAPLEAIAQGSVFLNAKLDPPHSRDNTAFFKEKPTARKLSSQHPYAEEFIGKPYVYTVDISNMDEVEGAIKEILTTKVKPYIPFEWTTQGMLERVNALVNNQNFCDHTSRWPPIEELKLIQGLETESCTQTCKAKGLLCDPAFFPDINISKSFQTLGIKCSSEMSKDSLHAPSYSTIDDSCLLQRSALLFSCGDSSPIYRRVCPCRDFQPQQVALCKNCSYL
ncbi:alpha-1,6-mannosylglycoprotein 6-beta-N-acetylglucosaminyltransferase A isoform X2 [Nematostella vectensis]|uniref:alpha-1,6-mannosylglycoprotein 6-beta-N-acetylglucosaminyltransferase A isoform X2 n=1 Tax=Nematostella vectensis TaxID=45351 RepID=UPI0020772094|nr:alpha-1,6-mannosylglycoprotein 6-beta-N-acetylglucosaminyltransferase A isoform X2 [Nematostella vectensis]